MNQKSKKKTSLLTKFLGVNGRCVLSLGTVFTVTRFFTITSDSIFMLSNFRKQFELDKFFMLIIFKLAHFYKFAYILSLSLQHVSCPIHRGHNDLTSSSTSDIFQRPLNKRHLKLFLLFQCRKVESTTVLSFSGLHSTIELFRYIYEDIGFEPISNACKAQILPIKLIPKILKRHL